MKRKAGILLHISSLPGPYPIGDFGPEGYRFVDFLKSANFSLWQILPLIPPDEKGSPYSSYSALGISRLYLSPELLIAEGLLAKKDIPKKSKFKQTNFQKAFAQKSKIAHKSYEYFLEKRNAGQIRQFKNFCSKNKEWLADHALFDGIKEFYQGRPWFNWPRDLKERKKEALNSIKKKLTNHIEREKYVQWQASRQWMNIKKYANSKGIKIVGDIPFYVRHDSVDVWAHQDKYLFKKNGSPSFVSGVPPDMFSKVGQRWGNPVYNWKVMEKDNFIWWVKRIKYYASLFDALRLDHFRGYESLWYIPAREKDARKGRWVKSPGKKILSAIKKSIGKTEVFAEDLGYITKEVDSLRDDFNIPGTRVILFGLDHEMDNPSLPHNFPPNCVSYTGTHDTDTVQGWFDVVSQRRKEKALAYTGGRPKEFSQRLIKLGLVSKSNWFIIPVQDILGLGKAARMNTPNTSKGNWQWRLNKEALNKKIASRYKKLIRKSGRI